MRRLGAGSATDKQLPVIFQVVMERLPIGLPEIPKHAPRRSGLFYEKWYRPDQMAVVGRRLAVAEAEKMVTALQRHPCRQGRTVHRRHQRSGAQGHPDQHVDRP
jgi:hypothetical protein